VVGAHVRNVRRRRRLGAAELWNHRIGIVWANDHGYVKRSGRIYLMSFDSQNR
jgi:hypothetical protein